MRQNSWERPRSRSRECKALEHRDLRIFPICNRGKPDLPSGQTSSDEVATLIKVAKDFLQRGDIASARVLRQRAATAGNAQAALELGKIFDHAFLAKWGVLGFAADPAQARELVRPGGRAWTSRSVATSGTIGEHASVKVEDWALRCFGGLAEPSLQSFHS